MGDLTFRQARAEDARDGAALVMETLHEFGAHLFGFGDHGRALQALENFFALPRNRFSYQYAEFALADGETAGILMLFNRRQMRRSMAATALQMARVYRPGEIMKFLKLMMPYKDEENIAEDELYIGHLAVNEKFRRRGFGLKLLAHAEEEARRQGLAKLSLLTEIENHAAQTLYQKYGLHVTETILFPEGMRYMGSAGDVRMVKIL